MRAGQLVTPTNKILGHEGSSDLTIGKTYVLQGNLDGDHNNLKIIDDNGDVWGFMAERIRGGYFEVVDTGDLIEDYINSCSDDEQQLAIRITDAIEIAFNTNNDELIQFIDNFNKWRNGDE